MYPVHAGQLNFSNRFKRSLTWDGLTLLGSLPVKCTGSCEKEKHEEGHTDRLFVYVFSSSPLEPHFDAGRLTSPRPAREERMIVLHECMRFAVESFVRIRTRRIMCRGQIIQNVHVHFCIGIVLLRLLGGKDVSTALQEISVSQPRTRCGICTIGVEKLVT